MVAVLSNVGFVARLSLYDGQNLLVQSDGSAGGGPDELIDQHLQAGTFFLGVAALSGSGTFRLSTSFTATSAPFASSLREFNGSDVQLASADFNHDGVLDLVTPEGVRLGTGDGTFQAAPTGTPTFANMNTPDHIVTGDLNGDGIPDLVVTDPVTAEVTVLLGRGDGTFRRLDPFAVPGGAGALVEADFNHDGRPDLAVAGRDSAVVTVLLGNGDGTFRPSQSFGTSSTPGSLAVGDFNGDGRPDLAVACQTSTGVSVLYGQGDGTFSGRVDLATTYDPSDVAAGDLNGDGRSDLIVLVGSDLLTTYLSQKNGTFLVHSQPLGGIGRRWRPATSTTTDTSTSPCRTSPTTSPRCFWATGTAPFRTRASSTPGNRRGPSWPATSTATAERIWPSLRRRATSQASRCTWDAVTAHSRRRTRRTPDSMPRRSRRPTSTATASPTWLPSTGRGRVSPSCSAAVTGTSAPR